MGASINSISSLMSKQKQSATPATAAKTQQKPVPTREVMTAPKTDGVQGLTGAAFYQSIEQQLGNPTLPRIQRQVMVGQAALHMGNEHFLRVHKTQQVSTPIFHFSHSQSIQKDDSNGGSYEQVYFTTYQGRNIIYEYRDGKRTYHLSYRNHAKRNYYRRGDIILKSELESKQLQKIFTQLGPSNSGDKSAIEQLLELFNTKSYKIGRRIINVETSENGEGSVELQPVLIFSHSDIVPIGEPETRNRSQLSGDFIHHATAQELSLLVPILEGIAEFTGDVLTPGRRAAVKGLGSLLRPVKRRVKKQLMKYTALAIARRVLRKTFYKVSYYMGKAIPKAIIEFISTFGKELNGLYQDYQFRSRASQQQRPIPERKIYAAIINAGYSSIATLLEEMFGEKLLAHLDKAAGVAEKVDPIFGKTLKQRITNYIKRKFVRFMTVDRVKMLTHTAKEAIAKRISEGGTISEHLSSSLVEELKESAQSQLEAIPKELTEQFDLQDK
jgi:hypothetical protein